jgi:hypothetical protein
MNTWDGEAWSGALLDEHEPCEGELPPLSYGEFAISRNGEAKFTSEAYQVYEGDVEIARYQCDKGGNCKAFSYYNPAILCGCEGKWFRRRGRLLGLKIIVCSKPPTFEPIRKYLEIQSKAVKFGGDGITVGPRLRTAAEVCVPAELFSQQDVANAR